MTRMKQSTLAPVYDTKTRVMILGSFPGEESLRKKQYYANQRNIFWRIMGDCLGEDIAGASYENRLRVLMEHGLGLWDVYGECQRVGSLDSAIRKGLRNDLSFFSSLPRLELVCFNGQKSAAGAPDLPYKTVVLPSSSLANTRLAYENKVGQWYEAIFPYIIR